MKKSKIILVLSLAVIMAISLVSCGGGGENGELYVYNFGDYIDPDVKTMFEEETGIRVIYDTYDTNEEMYPIIKNQSANYDIVCPSDYMIEKMIGDGLLAEIDYDAMPNYKNLDEKYLKMTKNYDEEGKYSVPHTWGTAGILYNTEKIPKGSITSWKDLWKPEFAGHVVMQDSVRDTMMVGLKMEGHSLNTMVESELKAATDLLIEQKPLVYKYVNDSARDLLINESASIGVIWNGEVLYCQELNDKLDFVVPKEGSQVFVDAWAITANAKNKENALKWIDFMCREDIAYKNFQYLTFSIPNGAAIDMMDEELKNNKDLFPNEEIINNCEVLKNLGPEGDDLYSKYWKMFKAE